MRVAVSVQEDDLNAKISSVFGRCKGFLIIELAGKEIKEKNFVENPVSLEERGAGTKAAQNLLKENIGAVISRNFGPNSLMVFSQAKIKAFKAEGISAKEAVMQLAEKKLEEIK